MKRTEHRGSPILAGLICLAALWLAGGIRAEVQEAAGKAAYAFDQAIQSYLKGDSQTAIQQLDECLRLDPGNPKAKVFLLKILVERGSRLFLAKQYQKAYDYLSRAYNMDPANQQVRQMFDLAAKQVAPPKPVTKVMLIPKEMQTQVLKAEAAQRAREQGAPEAAAAATPAAAPREIRNGPVYAEPAPMEAASAGAETGGTAGSAFVEEYARNAAAMMTLLANFQQRQERQLSQFMVPLERIQQLYYKSEEDRKNFINQLDSRFQSVLGNISFQQRLVIYGFSFGLLLLGGVVWGFLMIVNRMRSRREEVIMKYQQEMLKMVRDMAALPGGGFAALPNPGALSPGMRLPGQAAVPVIPATDPAVQLEEAARSGNIKERSRAAMQMLSLDAERAVDMIRGMISDQDPFQRECMASALGEQYHPLIQEMMLQGLRDPERRVASAAARAFKRWEQLPAEVCPEEVRNRIRGLMKQNGAQP